MIIGVPKEGLTGERRVGITPSGCQQLCRQGHKVIIQADAGTLSGYSSEQYSEAGASVVESNSAVWQRAELLVKVKEPTAEECAYFRKDCAIFCFLHLAVHPKIAASMLKSQVTAFDYDLLATDCGRLPILEPMSAIAGALAVQCGALALQADQGGSGILLSGIAGVPPAEVCVIGVGTAGSHAAIVSSRMGARVTALDIDVEKLRQLRIAEPTISTRYSDADAVAQRCSQSDLVIGTVLIPGARAPKLITRKILSSMRSGSVLVDVCIDQGGVAETSKATSLSTPTYVEEGVVHFCVPNMPAMVPRTSTMALTNASLPWIQKIADNGIFNSIKNSAPLRRSLTTVNGLLCNPRIGEALGIEVASEPQIDKAANDSALAKL